MTLRERWVDAAGAVRRRLSKLTEPVVMFPLLGALLLGLLWIATAGLIRVDRANTSGAALAQTQEQLDTYESQVVRVLRELDQTLELIRFHYEQSNGNISLAELEARGLLPPPIIFTVSIFDGSGVLVDSTRPAEGQILGLDDFPEPHDDHALRIGLPTIDPETGAWTQRFGRPLLDRAGEAVGVVTVAVESAFFVSGYETSKLGDNGLLALLGTDGVFRARRTGDTVSAGDLLEQRPAAEEEGVAEEVRHRWDGITRYAAQRTLYEFPLQVVVGVAVDEALAPAARRARTYVLRAAAASVVLIGIVTMLGRLSWQLHRLRQREYLAQVEHTERVAHIAYHDGLTGLPNRSFFSKLLEQNAAEATRYARELAVLFIDLDRFKQINDTLGHEAGDDLLREVARRLRSCLRQSDVVARLGGDEFVVLLPNLAEHRYATTVAEKILAAIAQPFLLLGQEFRVTASIGISLYPKDGLDEQTLTKNADIAMYRAKEEGKNNFQFYSDEINKYSLERMALEASLRRALEGEEFRLHYQARCDASSGRVTGVEALLRWEHPDLSTVPPTQFLEVAEEIGLIVPLGRWVLRTACRQNMAWQAAGLPRLLVAVNLTLRQLFDEHLVRDVKEALASSGMDADLLEIEVREEHLLRDVPATLLVLQSLKEIGVRIVIDHFGAGYSSLARLERYPLDAIKIDRSCVRESTTSSGLTDAIVAVGKTLSVTVVAQGIETEEQEDFVRDHGCDEVQGFHVHRPMPADQLTELLLASGSRLGLSAGPFSRTGRLRKTGRR
jgi:diguanylate cyclase (GGDEF)-like protein